MVEGPPSAITRAGFASLRRMLRLIARPTTKSATRIGSPFVPGVYKPRALMSPLELEPDPGTRRRKKARQRAKRAALIQLRDWLFETTGPRRLQDRVSPFCNHRVPLAESAGPTFGTVLPPLSF
jgi:hypothetical protein